MESDSKVVISARHFVETTGLLEQNNIHYLKIGEHGGKLKTGKIYALLSRSVKLQFAIPYFDISISSNYEAPLISWLRDKKAIIFDDNDISPNWLYAKFASFIICPDAIDIGAMVSMGINSNKIITYRGFKEDIYIAGYIPDLLFPEKIPFKNFITVRPENIYASYVSNGARTIVPELIDKLTQSGYNILYLPRYETDRSYFTRKHIENVFIPDRPLNGLDVCYYSDAVLTGAGSFSREAALLGTPAVSFFAGAKFLSVDKKLFEEGRIFYSRKTDEILEYVKTIKKTVPDISRSIIVRNEVFRIIDNLIS